MLASLSIKNIKIKFTFLCKKPSESYLSAIFQRNFIGSCGAGSDVSMEVDVKMLQRNVLKFSERPDVRFTRLAIKKLWVQKKKRCPSICEKHPVTNTVLHCVKHRHKRGGADEIRTRDLLSAIQARSQLRHSPTSPNVKVSLREGARACQRTLQNPKIPASLPKCVTHVLAPAPLRQWLLGNCIRPVGGRCHLYRG